MLSEEKQMTVGEAVEARAALTGDAAKVANLIDACLNAKAAFSMMGIRTDRSDGFTPVGSPTMNQIEDVLATMPEETALVKASMAFACEVCGKPAESGTDDYWICDACIPGEAGDAERRE